MLSGFIFGMFKASLIASRPYPVTRLARASLICLSRLNISTKSQNSMRKSQGQSFWLLFRYFAHISGIPCQNAALTSDCVFILIILQHFAQGFDLLARKYTAQFRITKIKLFAMIGFIWHSNLPYSTIYFSICRTVAVK